MKKFIIFLFHKKERRFTIYAETYADACRDAYLKFKTDLFECVEDSQ